MIKEEANEISSSFCAHNNHSHCDIEEEEQEISFSKKEISFPKKELFSSSVIKEKEIGKNTFSSSSSVVMGKDGEEQKLSSSSLVTERYFALSRLRDLRN